MQETTPQAGIPLRQLLGRCVELRPLLPELSPLERERLPDYATWWQNRERIEAFDVCVKDIRRDGDPGPSSVASGSPLGLRPRRAAPGTDHRDGRRRGARLPTDRGDARPLRIPSDQLAVRRPETQVLVDYAQRCPADRATGATGAARFPATPASGSLPKRHGQLQLGT